MLTDPFFNYYTTRCFGAENWVGSQPAACITRPIRDFAIKTGAIMTLTTTWGGLLPFGTGESLSSNLDDVFRNDVLERELLKEDPKDG